VFHCIIQCMLHVCARATRSSKLLWGGLVILMSSITRECTGPSSPNFRTGRSMGRDDQSDRMTFRLWSLMARCYGYWYTKPGRLVLGFDMHSTVLLNEHTTHTHNHFTALWILSGTTGVSRYQKKHSPTYTYRGHQSSLVCFFNLIRSMASSLFNPRTWQSTISLQVFFDLPLGLTPSTSYSIHFFTQSLSSFRGTCSYHHNLFCCSTKIMSSNTSLCQRFTWNSVL